MFEQTETELAALEATALQNSKKLKVEVIADNSGKWCGNGMTFDTAYEAVAYGWNLSRRWTAVEKFRVSICE